MKINIKTKYFINAVSFAFIFALIAIPALASEITADNVIKYVNESREAQGLPDLIKNEKLTEVAQAKLDDMIKNKYFAHTSPSGINPWYWFEKIGYDYQYAGENLAINFTTAEAQQKAWMESLTHRKNILNPNYNEVGVAIGAGEINGEVSIIAVQEFGVPSGAGEIGQGAKNFSADKKDNLISESEKMAPQVLSVKDISVSKNNSILKQDSITKMKVIELAENFSLILFLLSLIFIPIAFLSVAFDKIAWVFMIEKARGVQN